VNVMTNYLPSSLVEHADGKLLSTSTEPKPVTPASTSSCGPRPKPTFDPQGLSHHVGSPGARAEIPLSVDIGPGGHEWSYWDARIQDVLQWLPLSDDAG
jgi:hypothetical protein